MLKTRGMKCCDSCRDFEIIIFFKNITSPRTKLKLTELHSKLIEYLNTLFFRFLIIKCFKKNIAFPAMRSKELHGILL